MKKLILIFVGFFLTAILMTSVTSCRGTEENHCEYVQTSRDYELDKLYNSIDSLSNAYAISSRANFVDKWGKRFAVATVDACVSLVSAPTIWMSIVCSTMASWLYEDYLNYVDSRYSRMPRHITLSSTDMPTSVVFPSTNTQFVDSIGYYHNLLIDQLRLKGVSFVDVNGNIDYNGCFHEVTMLANEHGIPFDSNINKPVVYNYIHSLIVPFSQLKEGTSTTFLSIIFNRAYDSFNYDEARTIQLRNICEKVIYNDLMVEKDVIIDYGTKLNDLIVNSNVDSTTKQCLQIANNITVNSSLNCNSD